MQEEYILYEALLSLSKEGDLQQLMKIIQNINDIQQVENKFQEFFEWTLLHCACFYGRIDIADYLINKYADPDIMNKNKERPIHYACINGNLNIVKLLLQRGASPIVFDNKGFSPLHRASEFGHTDIVKLLLYSYSHLNIKDKYGRTPLHYAAEKGFLEIVNLLLSGGFDIHERDRDGNTPYKVALLYRRSDVVKIMDQHVETMLKRC